MLKIDILNGMGHTLDSDTDKLNFTKLKVTKFYILILIKKKKHSSIGCQTDI